jgi:hypothetical protein
MKNGSNVIIYKYIVVQKWLYVAGGSITGTLDVNSQWRSNFQQQII